MKYSHGAGFVAWQPSTWPKAPATFEEHFVRTLRDIIQQTILDEISNVITDAQKTSGGLGHRGHIVALAMLCAVDAISSYAFPRKKTPCSKCGRSDGIGPRYEKFIRTFFPADYRRFAKDVYKLHRNSMVHSWNLFEAGIFPGAEKITKEGGSLSFGLLNFFTALNMGAQQFLAALPQDQKLQQASLSRYRELKASARL